MTGQERNGVACVGNLVLDVVHDISHWPNKSEVTRILGQKTGLGSGAANVAIDLTIMGAPYPLVPVGLVGAGPLGDEVLRLCRRAALATDRIARTGKPIPLRPM